MSSIESSTELYREYDPFFIHRVSHIEAQRNAAGIVIYDVYLSLEAKDMLTRNVVHGKHLPHPWLRSLRTGENPSTQYLTSLIDNLSAAQVGESIQLATPDHPMRWSGAGGMVILRDSSGEGYVPLTIRPDYSFYPHRLDAQGGLSSRMLDWVAPQILGIREIAEEILIVNNGAIQLPVNVADCTSFNLEKFKRRLNMASLMLHIQDMIQSIVPDSSAWSVEPIEIREITPFNRKDVLNVHMGENVFTSTGIVCIDAFTGSLDLRNIYEISVDNFSNMVLLDGESQAYHPHKSRDREVYLFTLEDLLALRTARYDFVVPYKIFINGMTRRVSPLKISLDQEYEGSCHLVTPALTAMIQSVN